MQGLTRVDGTQVDISGHSHLRRSSNAAQRSANAAQQWLATRGAPPPPPRQRQQQATSSSGLAPPQLGAIAANT